MYRETALGELYAKTGLKTLFFPGREVDYQHRNLKSSKTLKGPYGFPLLQGRKISDKNFQEQSRRQIGCNVWNARAVYCFQNARAGRPVACQQWLPMSFRVTAQVLPGPPGRWAPWPLPPACPHSPRSPLTHSTLATLLARPQVCQVNYCLRAFALAPVADGLLISEFLQVSVQIQY